MWLFNFSIGKCFIVVSRIKFTWMPDIFIWNQTRELKLWEEQQKQSGSIYVYPDINYQIEVSWLWFSLCIEI